jgi:hypothetical protein
MVPDLADVDERGDQSGGRSRLCQSRAGGMDRSRPVLNEIGFADLPQLTKIQHTTAQNSKTGLPMMSVSRSFVLSTNR